MLVRVVSVPVRMQVDIGIAAVLAPQRSSAAFPSADTRVDAEIGGAAFAKRPADQLALTRLAPPGLPSRLISVRQVSSMMRFWAALVGAGCHAITECQ